MTGTALLEFDRKVTHAFQEAIQELRGESLGEDRVREVEPLVQRCAERPIAVRQLWEHCWLILANQADESDDQRIGEILLSAINDSLDTLRLYQQFCERLGQMGIPVPSASKFGPAVEEVERIKKSMDNWPWVNRARLVMDPQMVEEARATTGSRR